MKPVKISNKKIYEQIAEHLKQQIIEGKLKPGEKLPSDHELSQIYSVGRSTIREALSALKFMGLIETRQGEGSTVSKISPEDLEIPDFSGILLSDEMILELIEARTSFEISTAELAAKNRREQDIKKLKQIIDQMEDNLSKNKENEKIDLLFHRTIAEATHNAIMVRIFDTISGTLEKAMKAIRSFGYPYPFSPKNLHEHKEIFHAIQKKNTEKARFSMINHLDHFNQLIHHYMKWKKSGKND